MPFLSPGYIQRHFHKRSMGVVLLPWGYTQHLGCPGGAVAENRPASAGDTRLGLDPWMEKIPWRGQPTPLFLPGKFHGQSSLIGYSPKGHKESDTAENTPAHVCAHTHTHTHIYLMHTFHSWLQGTETLIRCSFQKWELFFPCITGYLEVSSPGPVPLIDGVYGQGPRCWHSLCYVLVVFMLVVCGHKVVTPSLSSPEEARDGCGMGRKACVVFITPPSADRKFNCLCWSPPSPMAQSYLIFFFFLFNFAFQA